MSGSRKERRLISLKEVQKGLGLSSADQNEPKLKVVKSACTPSSLNQELLSISCVRWGVPYHTKP